MKILLVITLAILIIGRIYFTDSQAALTKDSYSETVISKEERRHVSLALANILYRQMDLYRPFFDMDIILQEIEKLEAGESIPISKRTVQQQMLSLCAKISAYQAKANLLSAEDYIKQVAKRENIIEAIPGKVYYELLKEGGRPSEKGDDAFEANIKEYKLEDGEEIASGPGETLQICLSDTILGFAKGASGMACGERRKIYIHPEYAYGKYARHGFQQLLIYDVERL